MQLPWHGTKYVTIGLIQKALPFSLDTPYGYDVCLKHLDKTILNYSLGSSEDGRETLKCLSSFIFDKKPVASNTEAMMKVEEWYHFLIIISRIFIKEKVIIVNCECPPALCNLNGYYLSHARSMHVQGQKKNQNN